MFLKSFQLFLNIHYGVKKDEGLSHYTNSKNKKDCFSDNKSIVTYYSKKTYDNQTILDNFNQLNSKQETIQRLKTNLVETITSLNVLELMLLKQGYINWLYDSLLSCNKTHGIFHSNKKIYANKLWQNEKISCVSLNEIFEETIKYS